MKQQPSSTFQPLFQIAQAIWSLRILKTNETLKVLLLMGLWFQHQQAPWRTFSPICGCTQCCQFFFIHGHIEGWTHRKMRSLLLLPLGHVTNSGQFGMTLMPVISEPKHLTDRETLHLPPPAPSTKKIHVEIGMSQGQTRLYHWANLWKGVPDPQAILSEWKTNVF